MISICYDAEKPRSLIFQQSLPDPAIITSTLKIAPMMSISKRAISEGHPCFLLKKPVMTGKFVWYADRLSLVDLDRSKP
jgi:hypothetical protein